jgi:hypothetical protein
VLPDATRVVLVSLGRQQYPVDWKPGQLQYKIAVPGGFQKGQRVMVGIGDFRSGTKAQFSPVWLGLIEFE